MVLKERCHSDDTAGSEGAAFTCSQRASGSSSMKVPGALCPDCGRTTHPKGCPARKRSGKHLPRLGVTRPTPKTCCYPGCERPALLVGRCAIHFPGYKPMWSPYKTSWWRTARRHFIAKHPFCADPFDRHLKLARADEVDHIVRHNLNLDLFMDLSNLQSLCRECHDIKTGVEYMGSTKRAKREMVRRFTQLGLKCSLDDDGKATCLLCRLETSCPHIIGRTAFCPECCPSCPRPTRKKRSSSGESKE